MRVQLIEKTLSDKNHNPFTKRHDGILGTREISIY